MRILLIEDDIQLATALCTALREQGMAIDHLAQGKSGLLAAQSGDFDIVILDLGLPDIDGMDLLSQLRNSGHGLPVLILTARDQISDKISGLDKGADDYLVKPFDMDELYARLRVISRRLGNTGSAQTTIGDVMLDTQAQRISLSGDYLPLSRKKYMLLKALMENQGRIQSRESLESKLYEWGDEVASNAIEVHIHHLRRKLPAQFIKTIRGVGYCIDRNQSQTD